MNQWMEGLLSLPPSNSFKSISGWASLDTESIHCNIFSYSWLAGTMLENSMAWHVQQNPHSPAVAPRAATLLMAVGFSGALARTPV